MLAALTQGDLEDWELFDQVEPIGPRESRDQLGILLAKIHNRWRRSTDPALTGKDFQLTPIVDPVEALQQRQSAMIGTLRAMARPASERPRHRKHPKALKIQKARQAKRKKAK